MGFAGLTVVCFESRRADEMASLVGRHGGVALSAPTMREVARHDHEAARAFAEGLRAGRFHAVVLMTGVGTRALIEAIADVMTRDELAAELKKVVVLARGPKPSAVLREMGVRGFLAAPEPNTFREVLSTLTPHVALGHHVALQEHGEPSVELVEALVRAGVVVHPIAVYRWDLPEDTAPLRRALRAVAEGQTQVALFTSAQQIRHALLIAREMGIEDEVKAGLRRGVIGSVGPVCSASLLAEGLAPDVEPEHPKMGPLVRDSALRCPALLASKGAAPALSSRGLA